MNTYVPQNMEWTMPDKLVPAMGVPDALKEHPTFRLDQTLECHMKQMPNEYICPSDHCMNNARQILPCKASARRVQINPSCPISEDKAMWKESITTSNKSKIISYII